MHVSGLRSVGYTEDKPYYAVFVASAIVNMSWLHIFLASPHDVAWHLYLSLPLVLVLRRQSVLCYVFFSTTVQLFCVSAVFCMRIHSARCLVSSHPVLSCLTAALRTAPSCSCRRSCTSRTT